MQLSEHFNLHEFVYSPKAVEKGINNTPGGTELDSLIYLVENILEPLRVRCGKPIIIRSGFRCVKLNELIGGAATSQHMRGEAADIDSDDNATLFKLIRDSFTFDQLIWEKGTDKQPDWIHVSLKRNGNRKQVLRFVNGNYIKY